MERTTTKIYKEDLDVLRKLNKEHRLHGMADTISWLLDRHLATTPPDRKLCVVISESEAGALTATVHHQLD
jgi:hypothetical protein